MPGTVHATWDPHSPASKPPTCLPPHLQVDIAPHYYDLSNFPPGEARRALERLYSKRERDRSAKF